MQSLEKASEVCLRFHDIYTCEALERLGTNISQAYKVITFGYKAGRITREALEGVGMVPRGTRARAGKLPKIRSR